MTSSTTDTDVALLGDELATRRRAAGLTQAELAERAGVSVGTVRRAEQGHAPRSRSYALRLVRRVLEDLAA